jgi:site-specific recombinase XerD
MSTELTVTGSSVSALEPVVNLVLDTVSERSRRDYGRALWDFIGWHRSTDQAGLNRAVVQAHIAYLKAEGVGEGSINQRLAAIRKLATEAADNGLLPESTAQAIRRIENIKRQGKKLGNWLTKEQASAMLSAPDPATLKGLRDRAILAVMLGAGLRREEVAGLTVEHLQQREGRWVILDLVGKHNRAVGKGSDRSVDGCSWNRSGASISACVEGWAVARWFYDFASDLVRCTGL